MMIGLIRNLGALALVLGAVGANAVPISITDTTTGGFVGMAVQGPLDQPIPLSTYEEFVAVFGLPDSHLEHPYLGPSVAGYFANGGVKLWVVRVAAPDDASVIGVDGGSALTRTGLQSLLNIDVVSFVAAPGITSVAVQSALIAHCEAAGDRMAILDSESPDDPAAVQLQRAGLDSPDGFAALYFPWVQAAPTGESMLLPPSGFTAGLYSSHDAASSPIGLLATVTAVAHEMTTPEQDVLNTAGINALRNLSGIRVWGSRTLATNPELKYVAVRRVKSCLVESITEGTAWCVDESNDTFLWSQLRADTEAFLYDRFQEGWLQGATTSESFFVQCDLGASMSSNDIAEGRTILVFGYAVIRPAEFLVDTVVHQRSIATAVSPMDRAAPVLGRPSPNPFNPATRITLTVPAAGAITVGIYDLRGRIVRTLHEGFLTTGDHILHWSGTDEAGGEAPSGVYLIRAESPGFTTTEKLLLAR